MALLKDELSGIRTNRPTPKLVEDIEAEYAEQMLPIKQIGSISIEAPRNLIITPWDKSATGAVAKAVESAGLGLTAAPQGNVVRISFPPLTEERREELGKLIGKMAEEARIKMRIARDEVNKKVNAEPDEDVKFKNKDKLQKLVDEFNEEVDKLIEAKLVEIKS